MVTARDAYDDWYEDDEPGGRAGDEWYEAPASSPLELVRPARFAFEVMPAPESFEVAQKIADHLRAGAPVLVDFRGCDEPLRGRLTDFCSGLAYALEGTLQHVGREVLLVTPNHVDVSGDEASAVREPGFYNRS
jgi:cell division inhibitor SepF